MIPKTKRLQEYKKLHVVSYGINNGLEFGRYGVSKGFDKAYWGFLRIRTTFDIFQNIHILYLEYGVLVFSGYGVLILFPSCYFARIVEATALSLSSFRKRYISSYETPSSSSSLTLRTLKRYRGTSELILDTKTEDESLDLDAKGEGSKDKDLGLYDEGHGLENEGPGSKEEENEATPEGQQEVVMVADTTASEPLGLGYGEPTMVTWIDPEDGRVYTDTPTYVLPVAPVQKPLSPEWSSRSFLVSPSSPAVPSPIALLVATPAATILVDKDQFLEVRAQLELYESILHDHTQRLDALPPTLFEGYDRDLRELYTRSREVRDEIFSQQYRFRSLEQEWERATVTFGALWRPVLTLKAWAGHVNTRMAEMSHARYDDHRLIRDMLV
nr:hypothetical protein [Tanacetum cinerariifolium]